MNTEREMDAETEELVRRRLTQIERGVREAIRREVEWLELHNFPVWVSQNGRVVDARQNRDGPQRSA